MHQTLKYQRRKNPLQQSKRSKGHRKEMLVIIAFFYLYMQLSTDVFD